MWRIRLGPVNSPHKWSVTRKMFTFDNVIMRRDNKKGAHWWSHDRIQGQLGGSASRDITSQRTDSVGQGGITEQQTNSDWCVLPSPKWQDTRHNGRPQHCDGEPRPWLSHYFRRQLQRRRHYMGQVTKLWLSCYLVLLSIDSKTR